MDAIQIIRNDHRRMETLFRDFEEAPDPQTRKAIFDTIYVELDIHATLEEEIFYPSVQRQGERETVRHAEEEHGLVKELLNEMVKLDAKDPTFEAKFHVLKDNVKDHVTEEEAEMLPKAAEAGMSRLLQLGERMERRKEQLTSATNGQRQTASTSRRRATTTTRRRTSTSRSTTARKSTTSRAKASTARKTTTTRAKSGAKATSARKTAANGSRSTTSRSRSTASGVRSTTSRSRAAAGGSRSTARARTTARAGSTRSKPAARRSGTRSDASR
jgi:hemerythrin superfamily protein